MANHIRRDNLIEEELERVKRREREIQDEVYRERFEEKKKYRYDEMRSIGSRDSSHRGFSYDIAQELEEEREKKRQMAKELEIRERQIERTSELLERQSNMLANLEANRNVIMGQGQSQSLMSYNQQMTTSVYHQSILRPTDYQYSQQFPAMNPLLPSMNTLNAPSPYYQYGQQSNTTQSLDMYYNPLQALPLPVTGVIEEPATKKAKTETGVSAMEIDNTDADLKRKNQNLRCTYDRCKKTGHEIVDCQLLKKRSLRATCFYCKTEGHRYEQCPKLAKKQEKKKEMICFNCNTAGHHRKDCPGKKQAKIKVKMCSNCNTAGHYRKDCTAEKQEKVKICSNCNTAGHYRKDCTAKKEEKVMVCFNCNTAGHHRKDCPELLRPEMTESMKCYRCHSEEHRVKNCPQLKKSKETGMLSEKTKSRKCLSEGHQVLNCPQLRKSSKDAADVTQTVGMDEVDNLNNTAVTPSTLNNVMLSNLVSIACSDKALKSSSTTANASSATIENEPEAASSATIESAPSMASSATTTKSEPAVTSSATTTKGSATKRKRSTPSVASDTNSVISSDSVNSTKAIDIVQNTDILPKTTNPCSDSSNVEAKYTSILTSNPSKNTSSSSMSRTNCVTSKETTVASSAANPESVKGHTDFDIAEEMEKFKNNPKHMISMAKYRRHILNLRKAESERNKSYVQGQETETKVDSSGDKPPVKQEEFSSSQSQNSNSEQAENDNPSPAKESTKELDNPQLFGITCNVCQFTSKIPSEINTHKQTPQHIKKTELCETGCMMCGRVKFKTFTEYTSHKSEKLHKALLLKKGQISSSRLAKIADKVAGVEYVVPVSGFFCKLCKKFYNEESYAKDEHCRSKEHHVKIGEVVSAKYETAIRAKVLELYKRVKKHIKNAKEVPARFFKVLSAADFTNLKPLTSAKSPGKDQLKSKEIPQTVTKNPDSSLSVSKESSVTEVHKEIVKTDASDASDDSDASASKIPSQSCNETIKDIGSDKAPAKRKDISKASDTHIRNDSSTPDSGNTMKSLEAESGNISDKDKDVIKSKLEQVDAGAEPKRPSASIYLSGTKQDDVDDLLETKLKCEEIELDSESVTTCKDVHELSGKTAAMQYSTTAIQYSTAEMPHNTATIKHNTAAMQNDKTDDDDLSDTVVYDVIELEQMETEDGSVMQIGTKDSRSAMDPHNLTIKNVTSLKSSNVNFDPSSFRLKTSNLQEAGRILETGGTTLPVPVCSSTTVSLTEKKPDSSIVPTEKMDSTDTDADLFVSDDDETNLSGDCDSDIDLSDSLFNFSLSHLL